MKSFLSPKQNKIFKSIQNKFNAFLFTSNKFAVNPISYKKIKNNFNFSEKYIKSLK